MKSGLAWLHVVSCEEMRKGKKERGKEREAIASLSPSQKRELRQALGLGLNDPLRPKENLGLCQSLAQRERLFKSNRPVRADGDTKFASARAGAKRHRGDRF